MTTPLRRGAVGALLLAGMLVFSPNSVPAQESTEGSRKTVSKTVPAYPTWARTMNIHGSVRLEAQVAPNGTVKTVEIRGGHPVLAQAAADAIRQWKWEPADHETHEPVEVRFK